MNNDLNPMLESTIQRLRKKQLREYSDLARTYLDHAEQHEPGSLGWNSNMAEVAKYARLAAGSVSER